MLGSPRRTGIRGTLAAASAAVTMVVTACVGTSGPSTSGTDPGIDIAKIKALVAAGESGFLYSPAPDDSLLDPSAVVALTAGDWKGPTSAPAAKKGVKVEVISCFKGSACDTAAYGVQHAGAALGWQVNVTSSDFTPAGDSAAFTAAISRQPDVIVSVALGPSVLGSLMAQAHAKGIKVEGLGLPPDLQGNGNYDVTVPAPEIGAAQVELWAAEAATNGHARVAYLWDTGNPVQKTSLDRINQAVQLCKTCTLVDTVLHPGSAAGDPVQMQQLATSLVQKSGGNLDYILTGYGSGIPAIIAGVKASGFPKVKVMSKNGEAQEVGLVAKGDLAVDVGYGLDQVGWVGVDELVRLLASQPPLPIEKEGMVWHIFTKSNSAADGSYDWAKAFPYDVQYKKAWGV